MVIDEPFLDRLISNQRFAAKYYLLFSTLVIALGITILAVASFWQIKIEGLKPLLTVGSGFISTMSVFPIKEFVSRKNNANILEGLRPTVQKLGKMPIDAEERERTESQVSNFVDKIGLG